MGKTTALTEAVREALVALRDADVPAGDVRAKVVELHPELGEQVEDRIFSTKVYQQRDWAREQIGGQRQRAKAKAKNRRPSGPPTLQRYQMAERFLALCGGQAKYAEEVLAFLEKIDPTELRQAYEGWQQLVASAGNAQKARQVLATMRDTGMI
jgi:hypothetical protein